MATAIITIEFLPGDSIEEVWTEAIRIATELKCVAKFRFNGVACFAHPSTSIETGIKNYNKALRQPAGFSKLAGSY